MIIFVSPPLASYYQKAEVRDNNLITHFLGYCLSQNHDFEYDVYDFLLDRSRTISDINKTPASTIIICIREQGSQIHYSMQIAKNISKKHNVIFYGHISRIYKYKNMDEYEKIFHDEEMLFNMLFPSVANDKSINFYNGYSLKTYFDKINIEKSFAYKFRGAIETSRGCEFKCKFCFIQLDGNHKEIWATRSNEAILDDIDKYYSKGIKDFYFMDSEFLGRSEKLHEYRKILLYKIIEKFPDINYRIYCRADTLSKFKDLNLLKKSGMTCVYIGVESFNNEQLKLFKKGITKDKMIESIKSLMDKEIYMNLSLITFNRYTTIDTFKENIEVLKNLYSSKKSAFLGPPMFIYSFETSWNGEKGNDLSDNTYVKWSVFYRDQPNLSVVFDKNLEPLMEACRVLDYENQAYSCYMIECYKTASDKFKTMINNWIENLPIFSLQCMEAFLEGFESKTLRLTTISQVISEFYDVYDEYILFHLGESVKSSITKSEVLGEYKKEKMKCLSHGWDEIFAS